MSVSVSISLSYANGNRKSVSTKIADVSILTSGANRAVGTRAKREFGSQVEARFCSVHDFTDVTF